MEELRETSIHHTALKFSEDIKQMKVYSNLFKTVQVSRSSNFSASLVRSQRASFRKRKFHSKTLLTFSEIGMLARCLQG